MRPIPLSRAKVTDPFWKEWQRVVAEQSLPHQWEKCEETGRLENYRRAARGELGGFEGLAFNDSDLAKWAESAAYAHQIGLGSRVAAQLDEAVKLIVEAQADDGYLDTFYQLMKPDQRWTELASDHEMYCMGHTIEAAVAHAQATGRTELLHAAERMAACVAGVFGPEGRKGSCGHQEIELALCRLSDSTGNSRWRDLSRWMIEERGTRPSPFEEEVMSRDLPARRAKFAAMLNRDGSYHGGYLQDDKPLANQDEPLGHAVRAMYFYCGAHDSYPEGLPAPLESALKSIWRRLIDRRTYITGGIGSSSANEGFTSDYDLPNINAYAETCAGIGLIFWASRMGRILDTTEAADILERALYNAVLSGIGQDGRTFFYDNPLESLGDKERSPWFMCSCCPPNIARLILSLGQYAADEWEGGVSINQLFSTRLSSQGLELEVETRLPWDGAGEIRVLAAPAREMTIRIRAPRWADEPSASHGRIACQPDAKGWITFRQQWKAGDVISLNFLTPVNLVGANSQVHANLGRAAVVRGPLVYCLEEADLNAPVGRFALEGIDGLVNIEGLGTARLGLKVKGALDQPILKAEERRVSPPSRAQAVMVPYYSWANRRKGTMQVWLRRR